MSSNIGNGVSISNDTSEQRNALSEALAFAKTKERMEMTTEKPQLIRVRPLTVEEKRRIVLAAALSGMSQREFIIRACETEIAKRNLKHIIDMASVKPAQSAEPLEEEDHAAI